MSKVKDEPVLTRAGFAALVTLALAVGGLKVSEATHSALVDIAVLLPVVIPALVAAWKARKKVKPLTKIARGE